MTGVITRTAHRITRKEVRANADTTYFVFGDNMVGRGLGGLARECRKEPNSVGIPTKHYPSMEESTAFFSDESMNDKEVMNRIDEAIRKIDDVLQDGYDVIIPMAGIGSGLAQLPERAPRLFNYIEQKLQFLERKYNPVLKTRRSR